MKKTLLAITLLCFLGCKKSSDNSSEPAKKSLTVTGTFTPFQYGSAVPSKSFLYSENIFGFDGRLISSAQIPAIDHFEGKYPLFGTNYTYKDGLLSEKKDNTYKYIYTYKTNGDTSEINQYSENGLSNRKVYEYANGKVSSIYEYSFSNNFRDVNRIEKRSYSGDLISIREYIYPPKPSGDRSEYTYDSRGTLLTSTYVDIDRNNRKDLEFERRITYNTNGTVKEDITRKGIAGTGSFYKYINHYDINDKLIQQDVFQGNSGFDGFFEQRGTIKYTYEYN